MKLCEVAAATPDRVGQLRGAVAEFAKQAGCQDEVVEAIRLAVSEALSNVVMHAYYGIDPQEMILEAYLDDQHLVVLVCDNGRGLVPRPDSPGMGIGLALMAQLSEEFAITNREGEPGTRVELRFACQPVSVGV
jgi:serine/threonine-protein kinase RsbW/stage II sporulation protein AB (anti-sigma F factor)